MTISALSTSANSPNVRMVIGKVRKPRIGRTIALSRPSTSPATNAVPRFLVSMPQPELRNDQQPKCGGCPGDEKVSHENPPDGCSGGALHGLRLLVPARRHSCLRKYRDGVSSGCEIGVCFCCGYEAFAVAQRAAALFEFPLVT